MLQRTVAVFLKEAASCVRVCVAYGLQIHGQTPRHPLLLCWTIPAASCCLVCLRTDGPSFRIPVVSVDNPVSLGLHFSLVIL